MTRLVLVRHARPEIWRDVPAPRWPLSEPGVAAAQDLARRLEPGAATRVFSSAEPKALQTAQALAGVWGLTVEEAAGLHEHERPEALMLAREVFDARVRELFARPSDLVFGAETGDQARRRFTAALMRLVVSSRGADVIAVSHGTVMTLFVAEVAGVEPYAFWKGLGMPAAVTLSLPDLRLDAVTT